MEGYFIRALKGKKCHFVLTKTFKKKTGCKLLREKVTFYSAGECDGEKKVCFLPSFCGEKNCRGGGASCLPKWLPVTSQFSLVLWYFTKTLFLGVKRSGCLVFLSLDGWTQGVAERFSCPCCENRLCIQGNIGNCLTWSISARQEFSLSSLERLSLLQGGSFPLHLGRHKYSSFSEIHQNALQDTSRSQNIPPGSQECHFCGRNCNISVQTDFTNRD